MGCRTWVRTVSSQTPLLPGSVAGRGMAHASGRPDAVQSAPCFSSSCTMVRYPCSAPATPAEGGVRAPDCLRGCLNRFTGSASRRQHLLHGEEERRAKHRHGVRVCAAR